MGYARGRSGCGRPPAAGRCAGGGGRAKPRGALRRSHACAAVAEPCGYPPAARRAIRRFADQPRNSARHQADIARTNLVAPDRRGGRADLFRRLPGKTRRLRGLPPGFRKLAIRAARRHARMKAPGNFPPRVLAAWLAAAILLAVATVLLGVFGGGGSTDTVGPSTFSRS